MSDSTTVFLDQDRLVCQGQWNLANLMRLKKTVKQMQLPSKASLQIDGSAIDVMDSAGAWLLATTLHTLQQQGTTFKLTHFSEQAQKLLQIVEKSGVIAVKIPKAIVPGWLSRFGKRACDSLVEGRDYLALIGRLSLESLVIIKNPSRLRLNAVFGSIDKSGYQALPIIGLLSFLIGVVLAYQMGTQLRNYGANVFIVDLLGLSILREFGPLLTAIMVAGRTGSSFTAQLGIMKINQEIDALDTMGIPSGELLLIPRILALVIALPLLTIWADIFGILGGMVMANNMLHIGWYDFLHRFSHQIPLRTLIVGLGKTPVFAMIIASVGCFQGVNVSDNADSLGKNTTKSVVLAIFFIIVADAMFSIIFSRLQL